MRNGAMVLAMAAAIATSASAQLVGGGLGAGVGASIGSTVGGKGSATGAATGVGRGATSADVAGAARRDLDASDAPGIVGGTGRAAAGGAPVVRVSAGATVRTDRGARCYDGAAYSDPYQGPDGYYYCGGGAPARR